MDRAQNVRSNENKKKRNEIFVPGRETGSEGGLSHAVSSNKL